MFVGGIVKILAALWRVSESVPFSDNDQRYDETESVNQRVPNAQLLSRLAAIPIVGCSAELARAAEVGVDQ
jgi:hypothetical protein